LNMSPGRKKKREGENGDQRTYFFPKIRNCRPGRNHYLTKLGGGKIGAGGRGGNRDGGFSAPDMKRLLRDQTGKKLKTVFLFLGGGFPGKVKTRRKSREKTAKKKRGGARERV